MPQFSNPMQAEEFSAYLKTHLDWVFEDDLPTHDKLYKAWLSEAKGGEYEEEGIVITGFGAMPEKPIGGAFTPDKFYTSSQKTFPLQTWGLATVLEYELQRHDQYSIFDGMAQEMSKSAVDRCNILAYSILNNFFSTSDSRFTVYNGEALGDSTHALLGDGGTTSNRAASNAALTYTSLQAGRTTFMKMQNERGLYVRLKPECLIVEPTNEYYAQTLIRSALRPGTANNDENVLPKWKIHGDSPYLTSTTAWFLTASPALLKRRSMRFKVLDAPMTRSDFDNSTWNTVYSCYQANRVEVLHYQGTYGSDGTGV